MRTALVSILSVALLPLLLSCKKTQSYEEMKATNKASLAPIVEKHRAAAAARFTTLEAIGKDALAAPAVKSAEYATAKIVAPSWVISPRAA